MNDIEKKIKQLLSPLMLELFEFEDQSHLHIGHQGNSGGGHYAILVVSNHFVGMNRIERQRCIQNLLHSLFQEKMIHALSIRAQTVQEYFH